MVTGRSGAKISPSLEDYLEAVMELAGADEGAHPFNVKYLQYLKYEELARAKEGKSFDLSKFKREFWALAGYGQDRMAEESKIIKETPPERYEEAWERYLRR